jgi:hypothetical protein
MVLTTVNIINLARAKLLETTSEIISDETILIYANLSYQDIIKRIFTNDKILSATVSFTNGVGTLPTLFGTLYGSAQDTGTQTFEEVSIEDFENQVSERMVTIEGGTIKVYPSTTSSIAIKYYPTFASLTAGSTPAINEYFHECIVYGILDRAFEDLQDESLSAYYHAKYEGMITQKAAIQSNYEENNARGGVMWNYQQLI